MFYFFWLFVLRRFRFTLHTLTVRTLNRSLTIETDGSLLLPENNVPENSGVASRQSSQNIDFAEPCRPKVLVRFQKGLTGTP